MISRKQLGCALGLLVLSAGAAAATPARVETDLNVRSGEGTGFPVIAVMPAGEVVDVSGCGDGWCYVRDYAGFASAAHLDIAGVAYGAAPPVYVAPRATVVVPGPVYRDRPPRIRRGIREFRRELRRDFRQDRREARQERRQERREMRRERRQDRREVRQDRRERREVRQDRREQRQERRGGGGGRS